MRSKDILRAAATGVFLSLPVMGLLSLGTALFGRSFVVFDLFDALARALPGGVVTAGIDLLVQAITALGLGPTDVVAKQLEKTHLEILGKMAKGSGIVASQARASRRGRITEG
ncbi:MAG: hypothetical protein HGA45_07670, partial [Chloroflexales bacterium]|nr:hypothetical protein [Chloroflexales bacterium]